MSEGYEPTAVAEYLGVEGNINDGIVEARHILEVAKDQASKYITDARRKLARHLWKRRKEFQEKLNNILAKEYAAFQEKLKSDLVQYKRSLREYSVEVAISAVAEILGEEFVKDSLPLVKKIEDRISQLLEDDITVVVNAECVQEVYSRLMDSQVHKNIDVIGDNNLPKGIAIVETGSGKVEINWEDQLNRLKEIILNNS